MSNNQADEAKLRDEVHANLVQDDENIRARVNALLNQINESRVKVKELHADYAMKFGEIVSFRNRVDDMLDHYDTQLAHLLARKDELLKMIEKGTESRKF